ncbi:MAG: DUF1298 domain-containing protein [Propionibacteriaceae bacterium]|nr:DUF1298 domain-containing protein [Propionibacteriaceae bacterium]
MCPAAAESRADPGARPRIERLSGDDLVALASDGTVRMQVGAVLFLRTPAGWSPESLMTVIAARVLAVPRLRQRLAHLPLGLGRPIWQDVPGFRPEEHLAMEVCEGGHQAVLDLAADLLVAPLPSSRPLWTARLVTGFATDEAALVIVLHHVLADGMAALAILRELASEAAGEPSRPLPAGKPSRVALLGENLRGRLAGLRELPGRLVRLAAAVAVLASRGTPAVRTSLNQPTGTRRRVAVVECGLAAARTAAHAAGATINDLALAVIAEGFAELAATRGERLEHVVISVPVSARRSTEAGVLGNQVGVLPLSIPASGERTRRLRAIAQLTTRAKQLPPAASSAIIGPGFRWLARLGLFRWFTDRQRLVHTFASNLRGPADPIRLGGLEVSRIVPLSVTTGNIAIAFGTFSYDGELSIIVTADPDLIPDLAVLRSALAEGLAGLIAAGRSAGPG